jgi:hypothetical protein
MRLLCLQGNPFLAGVEAICGLVGHDLQGDGVVQGFVKVRSDAEQVAIANIHHGELTLFAESETIFAWRQFRSLNAEFHFGDQETLILLSATSVEYADVSTSPASTSLPSEAWNPAELRSCTDAL